MVIGFLKESSDRRVALAPTSFRKYKDLLPLLVLEKGAGEQAGFSDAEYQKEIKLSSREELFQTADVLISIHPLPAEEQSKLKPGTLMIALFEPFNDPAIAAGIKERDLSAISLDMIPRISLAQSMDVLSSMASIAGYRAVLNAALHLPRYFPMMITAAGSIRPAKVLVLGAGVAGLQAIATARRLGAVVEAFDVRSAVREEVQSLGAKFIEVEGALEDAAAGGYAVAQSEEYQRRQQALISDHTAQADVVISTAQLRGRPAPELIPIEAVEQMKAGSVIVDLAASTGGNCRLSKDGEVVRHRGVTIIGNSNLPEEMPEDASSLFSNNVLNLLQFLVKDGQLDLNPEHEIIAGSLIARSSKHLAPSQSENS